MKWENKIIGQGEEDPAQLLAHPLNYRRHPANQQEAMKGALEEVGWIQRVIVNQRTGHVLDGHLRIELALRHEQPVPVLYVDLDDNEEKLALTTFDPLSMMSEIDTEVLDSLLKDVETNHSSLSQLLTDVAANAGLYREIPDKAEGREYDESIEEDVEMITCPECGHEFPK